ncbi:MAG: glycosyl transferase [Rhodovulum sulfidophilum]|uniref:Glycosyl transferase n=1 Tax=Rhodovulum sulfidophilum TaxID=35806 RepID=A0A2W5NB95_RHOSU|nr:MAG: glycosyl transferase [Rhodovulum sulfidophilum]
MGEKIRSDPESLAADLKVLAAPAGGTVRGRAEPDQPRRPEARLRRVRRAADSGAVRGTGGDPEGGPFFSVVIPAYNRALTVERAIESCLRQTFTEIEVIVVDDGSSDDTAAVVGRRDDPRLVYIRQENRGASAARNRGAREARGAFLAFLDSDDEFLEGKLAAFHRAIVEAGEAARDTVWYSPLYFDRGRGNRMVKPARAIAAEESVGDYLFAYDGLMQTSTLVICRDLFLRARFDERLRNLEDLDLCLRLGAEAAGFRMLAEPLVVWHDDEAENRLSYTTTAQDVSAWVTERRDLMSERARYGFLARYFIPVALRRSPLRAGRILVSAVRRGSISGGRAFSLLLRGLAPISYAVLRDALTAQPSHPAPGRRRDEP